MESTFSLLVVEALVEEGVYQCRVFNNNGENSMETEVIDARRELHVYLFCPCIYMFRLCLGMVR